MIRSRDLITLESKVDKWLCRQRKGEVLIRMLKDRVSINNNNIPQCRLILKPSQLLQLRQILLLQASKYSRAIIHNRDLKADPMTKKVARKNPKHNNLESLWKYSAKSTRPLIFPVRSNQIVSRTHIVRLPNSTYKKVQ